MIVVFAMALLGLVWLGGPKGRFAISAWAIVAVALIFAMLVADKGWP